MNCFEHGSSPASGVCKSCGKGVCRACAQIGEAGVFCSAPCTDLGQKIFELNRRVVKMYGIGEEKSAFSLGPAVIIYGCFGLAMLVFAMQAGLQTGDLGDIDWRGVGMGLVFLGIAVYVWIRQRRSGLSC